MAANPQVVNTDTTIVYDGVTVPLIRGTVIDMPASGALATALSGKVTAMTAQQWTPGSSDSVCPGSLAGGGENGYGPGHTPYNSGQLG